MISKLFYIAKVVPDLCSHVPYPYNHVYTMVNKEVGDSEVVASLLKFHLVIFLMCLVFPVFNKVV